MNRGDRARDLLPRDALQTQRDLRAHVVRDHDVDATDVGEEPVDVVHVGILDVEVERGSAIDRALRAQLGVGAREAAECEDDDEHAHRSQCTVPS